MEKYIAQEAGDSFPSNSEDSPGITVSGLGSGESATLFSASDCTSNQGMATDTSSTLSSLSDDTHRFYFEKDSVCSPNFIAYVYDTTAPTAVTLSFGTSAGTVTTPDVTVSGVTPGDLIRVYSDTTCTTAAATPTLKLIPNASCTEEASSSNLHAPEVQEIVVSESPGILTMISFPSSLQLPSRT